jgi:hypothetical protein
VFVQQSEFFLKSLGQWGGIVNPLAGMIGLPHEIFDFRHDVHASVDLNPVSLRGYPVGSNLGIVE